MSVRTELIKSTFEDFQSVHSDLQSAILADADQSIIDGLLSNLQTAGAAQRAALAMPDNVTSAFDGSTGTWESGAFALVTIASVTYLIADEDMESGFRVETRDIAPSARPECFVDLSHLLSVLGLQP